jgi:excisionase family DNA binding protein
MHQIRDPSDELHARASPRRQHRVAPRQRTPDAMTPVPNRTLHPPPSLPRGANRPQRRSTAGVPNDNKPGDLRRAGEEETIVIQEADTPTRATNAPAESKLLLTVEEAAKRLGIGRTVMFASLGSVESVTIGRLRRVPADGLSDFVASLRRLSNPRGEGWVLLWMIADRTSGAPSDVRD